MQIEKQNRNLGTACSDTSGTDCSDSMVPITPLRLVPIQRYRQVGLNCLYSFLLMVLAVYVASKDGIWLKSDNSEVRNVFQVAMYSTFDKKE